MQSFDIFDTVLTRIVASPKAVFLLLGKKLLGRSLISVAPHEFARLRIEAETQARRDCGWGEVTLETIYHELATVLGLSEAHRQCLMQLECETEGSLLRVVPGAVECVCQARQRHGAVIYISDMYLPRSLIHEWLVRHRLWEEGDRLYLSNDRGASKATGELFKQVLADERMPAHRLTHRGNDPRGDVAVPARMGIRARPFPEGNLNRYEAIMESHAVSTGGLSSLMGGASRQARLEAPAANESERQLRDVSAGVMAPVLVGYVLWVLQRTRQLSLRRLYFLSRDGQILLEVARRLAPKLKLSIDLRYMYASRQSWHLPGITKIDSAKLEWICMKYDFLSLRSLLFRVELSPEQVAKELEKAGLSASDWERQLTREEIEKVKLLLLEGPVHQLILSRAKATRHRLLGYLRQEGMLDGVPWALIDVGWSGRLQASLGGVLETVGGPVPHGLYYALTTRPAAPSAGRLDAYSSDETQKSRSRVDIATFMEVACAADHGTVVGFAERNGRFEPMLRENRNTQVIEWGLPVVQDAIRRFADHLVLDETLMDVACDLQPLATDLIREFWETPTRQEAEAWGRFPFENDQSGTASQAIARPYDASAVVRALLGRGMGQSSISFWHAGSIMVSPPATRVALQLGVRVKRLFRGAASSRPQLTTPEIAPLDRKP